MPTPHTTVESAHTRYLRSVRLNPRAFSSVTVSENESSPPLVRWATATDSWQPVPPDAASVTNITWASPPVSAADWLNCQSTRGA